MNKEDRLTEIGQLVIAILGVLGAVALAIYEAYLNKPDVAVALIGPIAGSAVTFYYSQRGARQAFNAGQANGITRTQNQ